MAVVQMDKSVLEEDVEIVELIVTVGEKILHLAIHLAKDVVLMAPVQM